MCGLVDLFLLLLSKFRYSTTTIRTQNCTKLSQKSTLKQNFVIYNLGDDNLAISIKNRNITLRYNVMFSCYFIYSVH